MGAKSIKIALHNGTMDGIVTIEEDNRNELLLSAPREAALELLDQPESNFFGIYLLLSDDCVYIGETTDYSKRIRNHLAEKDWWDRVVFITTTDDKLNTDHIKHIEAILIDKAKSCRRLDIDNSKSGNKTNASRNDMIMLDNYLDNILFLLEFINVDVFSDNLVNEISLHTNINKSTIADFLWNEAGIRIGTFGKEYSYTGPDPREKGYYTIDPDKNLLSKDWRIIINDRMNYEIIIIEVPYTEISEFGIENFKPKRSNPNKVSVRIKKDTFIDTAGFDYTRFITQRIKY